MKLKRVIAVLMIGVLLLSFIGCKSGDGESASVDEFIESEQTGEEISGEKEEAEPEKEKDEPASEEKEEEPEEQPKEEVKPEEKPADPVPEKEEEPEEPKEPEQEQEKEPEQEPEKEPEQEPEPEPTPDPETEEPAEQGGPLYTAEENPFGDSLKILAIGNSFSSDGVEYLWDIANSMGIQEVVVGNLYIGNCSLDKHFSNMIGNAHSYRYYKNTVGDWKSIEDTAISTALKDEKWDVITLQQASGENTTSETYKNLNGILRYLEQNLPQKETKILWHMTWADQADSTKKVFETNYGRDQYKMYADVLLRIKEDVLIHESFDGVIPVGTAIQNVRNTPVGDHLTRDGHHLSNGLGRYFASLTWFCYITGADPTEVPFTPAIETNKILMHFENICKSVSEAIENPYEVMK